MISKVFPLSLLFVSFLAFARVQFHTQAELKNSTRYGNHSADVAFQLDMHVSLEVYNKDNVYVVAELLREEETTATVCFTIYAKNTAGEYEIVGNPVLVPDYTAPASLSTGSTDGEIFTVTVSAQQV